MRHYFRLRLRNTLRSVPVSQFHPKNYTDQELETFLLTAIVDATRSYIPQAYQGRITHFLAIESGVRFYDSRTSWGQLANDGYDTHVVPGNHTSMLREPYVQLLAEELKTYLDATQTKMEQSLTTTSLTFTESSQTTR